MPRIAGAVLAAGLSRRFQGDKLAQAVGGKTLLEWALQSLEPVDYRAVVLRLGDRKRGIIRGDFTVLVNFRPERGLSSSVKVAASWTPPDSDGLLLVLGDQPLSWTVTPRIIRELVDDCLGVSALLDGEPVSPALFSRQILHELLMLEGDVGAKSVVLRHRHRFRFVKVDRDDVLDSDRPEDLEDVRRALARIKSL
ncbi:MAG: nucleotidyltransferase family protein [Nitrososphaerota archaeon]